MKRTAKNKPHQPYAATVNIDMDKPCSICGQPGATGSGICLKCAGKAIAKVSRRKQPDLPAMTGEGVAQPSYPELDDLSEKVQAFKERAKVIKTGKEDAETQIAEFMQEHKLTFYETSSGKAVTLKAGKVTVSVTVMRSKEHE